MPPNCTTAIATVVVDNPIVADADDFGTVVNLVDVTTPSVFDGDSFNGSPIVVDPVTGLPTEITLLPVGTVPSGLTLNADGTITISAGTQPGEYEVIYMICEAGVSPENCSTATATVSVIEVIPPVLEDDSSETSGGTPIEMDIFSNDFDIPEQAILTVTDATNGTVTIDDGGTPNDLSDDVVTYTPNVGFEGTDTFEYTVCDLSGLMCATARVTAKVVEPCLTVSSLFSPNGDGINDFLHISCIENFENNSLEIFNRWGNTVYKARGYNNTTVIFEGLSDGRGTISEVKELPVGTYFYVLSSGEPGSSIIKGWIYINR